jgi:serine/threonine-protein kinase
MGIGASQTISRYRRLAELGRGGMATVYLAAARGPQGFTKLVVLKELRPDLGEDPAFRSMFLDEARLAARLNHPNVVQTYEVGEDGDRHVIVMEYLDGQPLSRARKVLPPPLVYFAISNVLTGLEHAHELHDFDGRPLAVVHRDVSPHNVFVTYSGEVKLCDFGIAKAADSSSVTATGDLKGKLAYMAPEQARGEQVDARADLFAVGVMLWETATGRRLWDRLQDVQILAQLLAGSIPSPRSVDPSVPEALERICMRALAYDPAHRYPTAAAMQADVDAYLVSLGLAPTRRALGEAVARAYAEDRERLKHVIEEQLRTATFLSTGEAPAVRFTQASLPSLASAIPPSGSSGLRLEGAVEGVPTRVERSASGTGRTAAGAAHSIAPAPSSGRAWMFAVAIGMLAVLTVGGFVVRGKLATTSARAAASASAHAAQASGAGSTAAGLDPSASGGPSAHAPDVTAVVSRRVTLRAIPVGAAVFLDGEPITLAADGSIERPAGETHRLRVEAAGFTTDERSLAFDADRTIDIRLVKARPGAVGGGRPGGPARPGPGKPSDPSDVLGY